MLLGIDTGGTFTDAVVVDGDRVVAAAKSPTTRHDLSIGVCGAVDAVLAASGVGVAEIELVSLSTTLATNALVEGTGRRVGAVIIGFEPEVLDRGGLGEAIGADPVVFVDGGHDPHGGERSPLDVDGLTAGIRAVASEVEAFAVMAQFSVRNPAHEDLAGEVIREVTGRPVSLSHHLSARLDGPRRALTAVLNARLVPVITDLVATTEAALARRGVSAPLMVVRGDGSLVSAAFVRSRPIETILSGPAASIVGAAHLTGLANAVISDIGGTTTDIAVLRDGIPEVRPDGAVVGGHRTMVSAVAMHTHGLGGDSRVQHDERAAGAVLRLGPRRVVPLSQLAVDEHAVVHEILDERLADDLVGPLDDVLVIADPASVRPLDDAERDLVGALRGRITSAALVAGSAGRRRALDRLVQRGHAQLAAFTPTDAAHVLGLQDTYDARAARKAAELFSRSRDRLGKRIAPDAVQMSELVVRAVVRRSAEVVLAAALEHDGLPGTSVSAPVVQAALDGRPEVARLTVGLQVPLVALGASAATYYPPVGSLLDVDVRVPEHAGVANAVGAVVGRVRISRHCTITSPQQGLFLVHADEVPAQFTLLDDAVDHGRHHVRALLATDMTTAGASDFEIHERWEESVVDIGGVDMFVEGRLVLTASGRPDLSARG